MRENETEAGKVRWVRPDKPDDVGGPVGRVLGTNPDITPPSKVQRPDAPTVKGKVLVGECGGTRQLTV